MGKYYIACNPDNAYQRTIMVKALSPIHECTYPNQRPAEYRHERILEVTREIEGIEAADLVIALLPAGSDTHTAIGYALALGKDVLLCYRSDVGDCLAYELCEHCKSIHIVDWVEYIDQWLRSNAKETA